MVVVRHHRIGVCNDKSKGFDKTKLVRHFLSVSHTLTHRFSHFFTDLDLLVIIDMLLKAVPITVSILFSEVINKLILEQFKRLTCKV